METHCKGFGKGVNGYNWIVPDLSSSNARIKLVATNDGVIKEVISQPLYHYAGYIHKGKGCGS